MEFTNPATKEKFEPTVEKDRMVHKAGLYSGMLSEATPEMAQAMVDDESGLVKAKGAKSSASVEGASISKQATSNK